MPKIRRQEARSGDLKPRIRYLNFPRSVHFARRFIEVALGQQISQPFFADRLGKLLFRFVPLTL